MVASICWLLVVSAVPSFAAQPATNNRQPAEERLTINQIDGRGWPLIKMNITLTGPDGRAVPGLEASQFEIREENAPQSTPALTFGPSTSVPLALALVLDVSGSMDGDKLVQAKASAITFLASLRPEDSAALISFNQTARVLVSPTNDRPTLEAAVNGLQAAGNTAVYDALHRAAQLLSTTAKPDSRRVIILMTDGADTSSRYSAGVARTVAEGAGVLVYTIGLGEDASDSVLRGMAEPTGGKYFRAPTPGELQGAYTAISLDLSSQLLLTYNSSTKVDRPYKLVNVQIKYTAKTGQVIIQNLRYRPPAAALIPSTPVTGIIAPPIAATRAPIPAGTVQPVEAGRTVTLALPQQINPWTILGSIMAAAAVFLFALGMAARFTPSRTAARLAGYTGDHTPASPEEVGRTPAFASRVLMPVAKSFGGRILRLTPKGYTDHIQHLLLLRGAPYRLQMADFLGLQFGVTVLLTVPLVWWAVISAPNTPGQWLLAGALGLVSGIYFTYSWLARSVRRRQGAILRSLPSALDFLAINVEAGLGFDAALSEVVRRWRNELTNELGLLMIDFQIGKPRKEAWRDLVQRTQVPDLTSFVTAILQNEQVGSSIGQLLRTQAEQMRIKRRQRAETAARVAPVKMLLPLVFFIFPGILVVVLGPAIPQIMEAFSTILR